MSLIFELNLQVPCQDDGHSCGWRLSVNASRLVQYLYQNDNETIAYISGEKKTEAETIAQYQKSKNPPREKAISARVNGEIYDRFRAICENKNMTTNAGLNMLIAEYVRQNE